MRRALLVLMVAAAAAGCGPGRGAGRRHGSRKVTPLVFSQHVPNVSENSLAGSGLPEGRITRNHEKFKDLVPNYNPDIIFKDEEGTGADRFMTQRCKEKLDTLAISVMNQWPGLHLKVTTGWVEGERHVRDSLHYEGRAVDITTSDRDRTKCGMLARLAVEAGFDWVYYESRSYIHCSVKSESTSAGRGSGCFPGGARVRTPAGERDVASLRPGDRVLAAGQNGTLEYSEVLTFLDRQPTEWREFIELTAADGVRLTATPGHLVMVAGNSSSTAVLARDVHVGDSLLIARGNRTRAAAVLGTRLVRRAGIYAPLTRAGTIVVDGALASCYALVRSHALAHAAVAPMRWFAAVSGYSQVPPEGVHWYIGWLYAVGDYVLPASYW